jgi:hypothetical protein
MKATKKLITICLLCVAMAAKGQTNSIPLITADSLASGNYKDVLSSFFQVAVQNLTGPNKDLRFSSNPFAIMLRANPKLAVDTSYLKYTALRNLNFSFDARIDSNYNLRGFASGIKYAIINRRDVTISHHFLDEVFQKNDEYNKLYFAIMAKAQVADTAKGLRKRLKTQGQQLLTDGNFNFNMLDADVKAVVMQIATDNNLVAFKQLVTSNPNTNIHNIAKLNFDAIEKSYQNKGLWTIGLGDTSYSDGRLFKNVQLSTEYLKGVVNPRQPFNIELDLKATVDYVADSTKGGTNLRRQIFRFEPGINIVLKGKTNHQPYLEFKVSGSYNNIIKGLYATETQINNTINGTLRIRIYDDIWIPFQIKYDTQTHNVFGFLNITTNFTGLSKLLNGKAANS